MQLKIHKNSTICSRPKFKYPKIQRSRRSLIYPATTTKLLLLLSRFCGVCRCRFFGVRTGKPLKTLSSPTVRSSLSSGPMVWFGWADARNHSICGDGTTQEWESLWCVHDDDYCDPCKRVAVVEVLLLRNCQRPTTHPDQQSVSIYAYKNAILCVQTNSRMK